jgi:hypothetical protein
MPSVSLSLPWMLAAAGLIGAVGAGVSSFFFRPPYQAAGGAPSTRAGARDARAAVAAGAAPARIDVAASALRAAGKLSKHRVLARYAMRCI